MDPPLISAAVVADNHARAQTHFTLALCCTSLCFLPRASPMPQETTWLDSIGSSRSTAQNCREVNAPKGDPQPMGARGRLITAPVPGASVDNSLCFSQWNQAPLAHSSDLHNSSRLGFPSFPVSSSQSFAPAPWDG